VESHDAGREASSARR